MRWGSGGLAGADLAQRRAGLAEGLLPPALPPVSISKRSVAPGRSWRDRGRPEAGERVPGAIPALLLYEDAISHSQLRCGGGAGMGGSAERGRRGGEARTKMSP